MKLISLNTLGGKYFGPLTDFIDKHLESTDIFCFQEVYDTHESIDFMHEIRADLWKDLSKIFMDFHKFYYPAATGIDIKGPTKYDMTTGLGIALKRQYNVDSEGDFFTFRRRFDPVSFDLTDQPVNLQYVSFENSGKKYLVCNFHGLWYPGDKFDTDLRIEQSKKILQFLGFHKDLKIICGDFNLMPNTQSIKLLDYNLRDLIKEFKIKNTRGKLDPYYGKPNEQKFADYIFVSPQLHVKSFEVPEVEVSDHLPLILEFN